MTDAPRGAPAHSLGRDLLAELEAGPPCGMSAAALARAVGVYYPHVKHALEGLRREGWATQGTTSNQAAKWRPCPREPRASYPWHYPDSWRPEGTPSALTAERRAVYGAKVARPPASAVEAIEAYLVERVKADPVAAALELATGAQLVAALARRRALGADPLCAAGLPPAE